MAYHKKNECPECEGEGNRLDKFDIPQTNILKSNNPVEKIEKIRKSKSGYQILDSVCPKCKGKGYVNFPF